MKKFKLIVKELCVGDVEDPDIYLGAVAASWMNTEHGAWVKEHAKDLTYNKVIDHQTYGYKYFITGLFSNEDALFYKLKWGHIK